MAIKWPPIFGGVLALTIAGTVAGVFLSSESDQLEIKSTSIENNKETDDFSVSESYVLDAMPDFKVLALDKDFFKNYPSHENPQDNILGHKYGWYLTGSYENNQDWWEWSYKDFQKNHMNSLSETFQLNKISSPYVLNNVCIDVAKKEIKNIINNYNEVSDLFRYCSPLRGEPLTIQDTQSYKSGTFGNVASNFISVTNIKNNLFWKLRSNEFFGIGREDLKDRNPILDSSEDSMLSEFYLKNKDNIDANLKSECEKIYLLDMSYSSGKVSPISVYKFCAW